MRTKVTLVLLFLNVALFFFIFHFERSWRTERAALEVRKRVLGPEAADIRTLTVTGPDGSTYRAERRGDQWFLTKPLEWPANQRAISTIVTTLQDLEHLTSFSVSDLLKVNRSPADYGLDHPKFVVTLTSGGPDTTGGAPVTTILRIGDNTPEGQSMYVLSPDGTRIHVISRELAESLAQPADKLVSNAVMTIPPYEANALSLQTTANLRVRLRRDASRWSFETPFVGTRANKQAVDEAIEDLDGLQVRDFSPAKPTGDPELRVTVEGDNRDEKLALWPAPEAGDGLRIAAGEPSHLYLAQREGRPAFFTVNVPDPLVATLRNAQEALRDRHVLDFDPGAVNAVTLDAPNQPEITLQRLEVADGATDGAGWQLILGGGTPGGPQPVAADGEAVRRLLSQLSLLTAESFPSDAPQAADLEKWGFNRPEREIALAFASPGGTAPPPPPLVLHLGVTTPADGHAYALLTSAQSVYAVAPDILDETPVTALAWRDHQLRHLPAGARITALRLVQATGDSPGPVLLEWKAGAAADANVQNLIAQLSDLRAQSFRQDRFTTAVGSAEGAARPWAYRLDCAISLTTGAAGEQTSVSTLWLSERLGGTLQLAGSPAGEYNCVFVLSQPMIDALWKVTYGARDPGPAAPAPAAKSSGTP
jgi:hypothetical protein